MLFAFLALLLACSNSPSDSSGGETPPKTETEAQEKSQPMTEQTPQDEPLMARNLRNALKNDLLKDDMEFIPEEQRRFSYAEVDLTGDEKPEYLVGFRNSYFCGSGGCTFLLLDHEGNLVTRFTVSRSPFIVLPTTSNGWKDIAVYSNGAMRKLAFNGKSYPSNPSVEPEFADLPGDDTPRLLDFESPVPEYSF